MNPKLADRRTNGNPYLAFWPNKGYLSRAVHWGLCRLLVVTSILGLFPHLSGVFGQSIRREFWTGIPGTSVSDLVGSPNFPANPTGVDFPSLLEGPVNWADDYGSRLRGYVHPPASGSYTFWISGDDNCQLYLSTDETPSAKVLIATVSTWTGSREWNKEPNQRSAPITLAAGQRYYLEALHKEGGGGDSVAVAWQLHNGNFEGPIPGSRLSPYLLSTHPPSLLAHPADLQLEEGQRAVFSVSAVGAEPLGFQWQRNGRDLPGENQPMLILDPVVLDDDETQFRCVVSNPLGTVISTEALLRVQPESLPPAVIQTTPADGVSVRFLHQTVVMFSEPVTGVTPRSLLLNGSPATQLSGLGAGPYTFTFAPPAPGTVVFRWTSDHPIQDLARVPNAFPGGSWTVQFDPLAPLPAVRINEFLAANADGLTDEDGDASDWLELHNAGATGLDLSGWSLSDDPSHPAQWTFPSVQLPPGGYLVVFASGKDRRPTGPGGQLHLNFKLGADGEPLGLYSPESPPQQADGFVDPYPPQRSNHSYGRGPDGSWMYFAVPTPGHPNSPSGLHGMTKAPVFSAERGFYRSPFTLHLSCPTPGAAIRYTLDGSEPTLQRGLTYTDPITINRTLAVRAAAFREGHLPSVVVTHTYLAGRNAYMPGLPVLSLVTDSRHLWGASGIMEPGNTTQRGIAWERPVSAEWIRSEDNTGFAIDCGLRIQGGDYVRQRYDPNAALPFSKYSFRLYFRGDYGARTLAYPLFPGQPVQEFKKIVLRAGMNDHSNPFIIDELVRRLHADTGQIAGHGNFVHLFLNGQYRGYYNPTERIDEDFFRSWTGSTKDWDVIAQGNEITDGDLVEWNRLSNLVLGHDLSLPQNYAAVANQLDVDGFIDYLLVNIYGATGDWPWNNWRAARQRTPDARWRFAIWDAEWAFGLYNRPVTQNTLTDELAANAPIANFYRALRANPEFRQRFGDRFHRHFYNDGALTDDRILAHFRQMRADLAQVIPGMDTSIETHWVPQRRAIIHQHLAAAGLQASAHAPTFSQHGGSLPPGSTLALTAPSGDIYFTLDGSDPARPSDGSERSFTLVPQEALKRTLVPSVANGGDQLGDTWKGGSEPFSDSSWIAGSGGVGYDQGTEYLPFFSLNLANAMHNRQPSAFLRIPFRLEPADLEGMDVLKLRVRYDDGFVAYLNGVRIAQANAPASPAWNSTATASNPDSAAMLWETFDVSPHSSLLNTGGNILAVHGLNVSPASSDFLISTELIAEQLPKAHPSPTATLYDGPITLDRPVTVKARSLANGQWSALLEADFLVNFVGTPLRITEIMADPVGGDAYEFLELANLSPLPVDLSGMSFEGIDYVFPAGSTLAGHSCAVLASATDPEAFHRRYPGVTIHGYYSGRLANGGERIALLAADGSVIHAVTYATDGLWPAAAAGNGASLECIHLHHDPNSPANWDASTQPGGTPGVLTPPRPLPQVRINEIMAINREAVPHDDTFPDWIELHNAGDTPISLQGWSFTDSSDPRRFVFPANSTIPAKGYLLVWCASDPGTPGLYTGFGLKSDGETVALYDPQTNRVDAVAFGAQVPDLTLGRTPSDANRWVLCQPTPNAANITSDLANPSQLRLNEWLAAPRPGEPGWIELFNSDAHRTVALHGLALSHRNQVRHLAALQFIPPRGYLVLTDSAAPGPDHVEINLDPTGSTLSLLNPAGEPIDSVTFGPQTAGVAMGRLPDGLGPLTPFPGSASPGNANYLAPTANPILNEFLAHNTSANTNAAGRVADWIEMLNPTSQPIPLAGYGLGVRTPDTRDWLFPDGITLPPHATLVVWCDPNSPASTQAEPVLNLGRGLTRSGAVLTLFNPAAQEIDRVVYGPQITDHAVGRTAAGWTLLEAPSPGTPNAAPAALGSQLNLRVNEWMAAPRTGSPWFELLNLGSSPVDLGGLHLSHDPSNAGLTNQHRISPLSFIPPEGWITYLADGDPDAGPDHVGFTLNPWGGYLLLVSAPASILDGVNFGIQPTNVAVGRFPDGADLFVEFPSSASPNQPNYLPLPDVRINEILAHTDPPFEDAVELLSLAQVPVDISGWYLSDQPDHPRKFRIPPNTILTPDQPFTVIYEQQFAGGVGSILPFTLNSYLGDTVCLSAADATDTLTGYRSQVSFGPTANGVSLGAVTTSVGLDYAPQLHPSFGVTQPATVTQFRTGTGAPNAGPRIGPVIISEIMANPPNLEDLPTRHHAEFVELTNIGTDPVPLFDPLHPANTWRLADAVSFTFPANLSLAPGDKMLIVSFDPLAEPDTLATFQHRYDLALNTLVLGPYQGRLADDGENLELLQPDPPQTSGPDTGLVPYVLVERVDYSPAAPWPNHGIGLGASLQRIIPATFANDPDAWHATVPSPGRGFVDPTTDTDGDGMPDAWEMEYGLNPLSPHDAVEDLDEDGQSNLKEYLSGTDPTRSDSRLELAVQLEPNGQRQLRFRAVAGVPYTLQYRDSLNAGHWITLLHREARFTSSDTTIPDPAPPLDHRYYRLMAGP